MIATISAAGLCFVQQIVFGLHVLLGDVAALYTSDWLYA
jgi:hypothetical protein